MLTSGLSELDSEWSQVGDSARNPFVRTLRRSYSNDWSSKLDASVAQKNATTSTPSALITMTRETYLQGDEDYRREIDEDIDEDDEIMPLNSEAPLFIATSDENSMNYDDHLESDDHYRQFWRRCLALCILVHFAYFNSEELNSLTLMADWHSSKGMHKIVMLVWRVLHVSYYGFGLMGSIIGGLLYAVIAICSLVLLKSKKSNLLLEESLDVITRDCVVWCNFEYSVYFEERTRVRDGSDLDSQLQENVRGLSHDQSAPVLNYGSMMTTMMCKGEKSSRGSDVKDTEQGSEHSNYGGVSKTVLRFYAIFQYVGRFAFCLNAASLMYASLALLAQMLLLLITASISHYTLHIERSVVAELPNERVACSSLYDCLNACHTYMYGVVGDSGDAWPQLSDTEVLPYYFFPFVVRGGGEVAKKVAFYYGIPLLLFGLFWVSTISCKRRRDSNYESLPKPLYGRKCFNYLSGVMALLYVYLGVGYIVGRHMNNHGYFMQSLEPVSFRVEYNNDLSILRPKLNLVSKTKAGDMDAWVAERDCVDLTYRISVIENMLKAKHLIPESPSSLKEYPETRKVPIFRCGFKTKIGVNNPSLPKKSKVVVLVGGALHNASHYWMQSRQLFLKSFEDSEDFTDVVVYSSLLPGQPPGLGSFLHFYTQKDVAVLRGELLELAWNLERDTIVGGLYVHSFSMGTFMVSKAMRYISEHKSIFPVEQMVMEAPCSSLIATTTKVCFYTADIAGWLFFEETIVADELKSVFEKCSSKTSTEVDGNNAENYGDDFCPKILIVEKEKETFLPTWMAKYLYSQLKDHGNVEYVLHAGVGHNSMLFDKKQDTEAEEFRKYHNFVLAKAD